MMGLRSMGGGGGNSSASNLSASALPFTVERLNPNPNVNPLLHYSDSSYVAEPFCNPSQYAHLSTHRVEPAVDSSEIISLPVSDGYRFSASASATPSSTQLSAHNSAYGGDVKPPYYNPYIPPLAGDENLLDENEGSHYNVALSSGSGVTSQHVEYGHRWEDNFLDDGKRVKRSEFGGNFSSEKKYVGGLHGYGIQSYRGGCGGENMNKFKEDSGFPYKNLNNVSDREVHVGFSSTPFIEENSCFDKKHGFFHYDSSETLQAASSSSYPESYTSVITCAVQKDFPNYQNSCSPHEKCVRPVDAPFPGHVSVTRSPTVVIRPPPAINWNFEQGATSCKSAGAHVVNLDNTNPSKLIDSGLKPNSKPKDDFFETGLFRFSKQGNTPESSISVKEFSSPLHFEDTSDCKIKETLESQMPVVNVSSGFNLSGGNIEVANSTMDSSEVIDYHNTAVDSPCWRGAPSSQFSSFDIEDGNSNHVKINLDEHYGFGYGEHQCFLSTIDSKSILSEKVNRSMGNENESGKTCETLGLEKTLDATCSTTEQISLDSTTYRVWIPPPTRGEGIELSGGSNILTKELNLLNNLTSAFDMKVSDTKHLFVEDVSGVTVNDDSGVTVNDVSEGAAVAVHMAEKVLASPASQEDAAEQTPVPDPQLDMSAFVKTIHSLSELLRFHISSDVCSLGEENAEVLKHVISSLNSCLSKKSIRFQAANNPEPKYNVAETSGIIGKFSSMFITGDLSTKLEPSNSCTKSDYLHFQKEEKNGILPGKIDEISSIFSPLGEDLHITGDDDMAKAIKKVLEQNLHMDEDMNAQALLFKSLWLDSEAKFCSLSYKTRFERMKIQMEEIKLKASKAYEDITEMTSEQCISPGTITVSELAPKARGSTFPRPTSPNNSTSGISMHADGIEASVLDRFNNLKCGEENVKPINTIKQQPSSVPADKDPDSVMARFNILKSREENPKPIRTEKRQQSSMAAGKDPDTVMARFNILKSWEENPRPINTEEQQQYSMAADKDPDTVMARFNILKSREENPKPINTEKQQMPSMAAGKDPDTVMARFNILKSREENPKPIRTEKRQQSSMAAGEDPDTVMARFNILKSREENPRPINTEEQQQYSMAADKDQDTDMDRFNILKSQEENPKPINTEKQRQSSMAAGKDPDNVMARFNILKSREENIKLISTDKKKAQVVNDEFAGEKYVRPCITGQPEDEALDVALQPNFQCAADSLSGGKFNFFFQRAGYESPVEYGISVEKDPAIHLVKRGGVWLDSSSSSDWEHVLKEDFSWKNSE